MAPAGANGIQGQHGCSWIYVYVNTALNDFHMYRQDRGVCWISSIE